MTAATQHASGPGASGSGTGALPKHRRQSVHTGSAGHRPHTAQADGNPCRKSARHQSAALFAHFSGVERRPESDAGNISIYRFEHGWAWLIPLRDGITSVGAVCWPEYLKQRRTGLEEFLLETLLFFGCSCGCFGSGFCTCQLIRIIIKLSAC